MQTRIIKINQKNAIGLAIKVLKGGGIIAFPTDTVYGIGLPVRNEAGIEKLFFIKGRDFNKAIAILIGDKSQIHPLTPQFNETAQKLAEKFWPGELTIVVEKSKELPGMLSPTPTIGIRMPDHEFTRKLLIQFGPLATTSANISGGENPLTADDVLKQLEGKIELLIDGGKVPGGTPSTVVDCTEQEISIIRRGSISEEEIRNALS